MTDRVTPGAIDTTIWNIEVGEVMGQFSEGWIVPAAEPTRSAVNTTVDETSFEAFDIQTSGSSLDATVLPGEAFVDGWLARDTNTTVTLPTDLTSTIYVGWDTGALGTDEVIIDIESGFSDNDPKLAIWEATTDSNGVTSTTDLRNIDDFRTANENVQALQHLSDTEMYISETEPNWEDGDLWFEPE